MKWPKWLPIGTRTLIFGVHQFIIHPLMVAIAWHKLFPPANFPIWCSFFLHDIGYWGKVDGLDTPGGKTHPVLGAKVMAHVFDFNPWGVIDGGKYGEFTLFHSRSYADRFGVGYSDLCIADKYATCMYPEWLYLLLANTSGEIVEYLEVANNTTSAWFMPYHHAVETKQSKHMVQKVWFHCLCEYMNYWTEKAMEDRA